MSMTAGTFPWQILGVSFQKERFRLTHMYKKAMVVYLSTVNWIDIVMAANVGNSWVWIV